MTIAGGFAGVMRDVDGMGENVAVVTGEKGSSC